MTELELHLSQLRNCAKNNIECHNTAHNITRYITRHFAHEKYTQQHNPKHVSITTADNIVHHMFTQ